MYLQSDGADIRMKLQKHPQMSVLNTDVKLMGSVFRLCHNRSLFISGALDFDPLLN